MTKRILSERSTLYIFDELLKDFGVTTNVVVIEGSQARYVIDTFCGPEAMAMIFKDLEPRETIVINTHHDWDHIWGNSYFKGEIIAHVLTSDFMKKKEAGDRAALRQYMMGDVSLKYPTKEFKSSLLVGQLILFYTPGHTADSISVYDFVDDILYIGDNHEVGDERDKALTGSHIDSLKSYLDFPFRMAVAGHGEVLTRHDVEELLEVLSKQEQ